MGQVVRLHDFCRSPTGQLTRRWQNQPDEEVTRDEITWMQNRIAYLVNTRGYTLEFAIADARILANKRLWESSDYRDAYGRNHDYS